ncbi:MAG TPA: 2-oxoglutarate and iron-dependent oxygenase domain-containing protein, partial [Methylomirabilota bacterium]|nr:2-oxoglutarate and iron-dependent oxygenase domain-containing protein [Methylomirabilota bacterium]
MTESLPIIDIASFRGGSADLARIGAALDRACCEFGFFYVTGHGIDPALSSRMIALARKFFALPLEQKLAIAMAHGGRAWRGYFPVDGELTSGRPDRKEGIYFGTELSADDPRVRAGVPLHGMNLYPPLSGFRETLLTYIDNVTAVGQLLLRGIAVGLGLEPDYFLDRYTRDPTVLFRIFNYPPSTAGVHDDELGVGEHTDYGLLTLLRQDEIAGLEVWHEDRWLRAPPVPDSFVCNVGDMLERLTAGRYASALHRVRNVSTHDRISMPLFLDPSFDAVLGPIEALTPDSSASNRNRRERRWDNTDLATISGTYGDYLLNKVSKVFPQLKAKL